MSHAIDSITSIQPPFNMIVLVVLLGVCAGAINTIATQIRRYACHRQELDLKRELLDRGMSAEEIVQVIEAKSQATKKTGCFSR